MLSDSEVNSEPDGCSPPVVKKSRKAQSSDEYTRSIAPVPTGKGQRRTTRSTEKIDISDIESDEQDTAVTPPKNRKKNQHTSSVGEKIAIEKQNMQSNWFLQLIK